MKPLDSESENPLLDPINLITYFVYVIFMFKTVRKAGYGWGMVIFTIFPFIGFIGFLVFAFSTWPIYKNEKPTKDSPTDEHINPLMGKNNSIVQK